MHSSEDQTLACLLASTGCLSSGKILVWSVQGREAFFILIEVDSVRKMYEMLLRSTWLT